MKLRLLPLMLMLGSCGQNHSSVSGSSFRPTQNGFGVVVDKIGVERGPGAGLYFKGTNATPVLVWPCIGTAGYPILYPNEIALLLADKPDAEGRLGHGALIAVKGPGPAMDVSKDILKKPAIEHGVDLKKASRVCQPLRLNQTNGIMRIYFVSNPLAEPSLPDLETEVTWDQLFAIMEDVRRSGKTNRVTNTKVPYIEKEVEYYGNFYGLTDNGGFYGHFFHGHNPDQTWRDQAKAMKMARKVYQDLKAIYGNPNKTYPRPAAAIVEPEEGIPDPVWDGMRGDVEKFVAFPPNVVMTGGLVETVTFGGYKTKIRLLDSSFSIDPAYKKLMPNATGYKAGTYFQNRTRSIGSAIGDAFSFSLIW